MDYKKIEQPVIESIRTAASDSKVIYGEFISADFCHDEYPDLNVMPELVVEAGSTESIASVLKICSENNVPVTVRGAGTGQSGGAVPVAGGVVITTKAMNKILEFENGVLRVQAGALLQDVKAAAEANGMYYPPDPGELTATIGGNVATNAGGPCAVKYGKTGDYVTDAVIVLADGTIDHLSSKEEFAAVIGSEGTLAVITEVSLRLVEKPSADAMLLLPFADIEAAIAGAKAILTNNFEPAVVELMDTDLVEFSGKVTGNPVFPVVMDGERVGATLMLTIEGNDDDDVMEKMEAISGLAEDGEIEPLDILVGDTLSMKREFWAAHTAFHTSMESGAKNAGEINIDVPTDALSEMISYAKITGAENGLMVLLHSHVGSGGLHIHAASNEADKEVFAKAFHLFADAVYAKCAALGGNIAGEYGIGYGKVQYMSEEAKNAQASVKVVFDPQKILNPGKLY